MLLDWDYTLRTVAIRNLETVISEFLAFLLHLLAGIIL